MYLNLINKCEYLCEGNNNILSITMNLLRKSVKNMKLWNSAAGQVSGAT